MAEFSIAEFASAALAGLASGFAGKWLYEEYIRRQLYAELRFVKAKDHYSKIALEFENGFSRPLRQCVGYVTIYFDLEDVIEPPRERKAYITPQSFLVLHDERLCWSTHDPVPNPARIDIFANEKHSIELFDYNQSENWIGVFTEKRHHHYRVFLRGSRVYRGAIKIASADITAKSWEIEINLANRQLPVRVVC